MSEETPPKGNYIVAQHGGEYIVCWVADAAPAWWRVVARFTNKDRAMQYCDVENDCYSDDPDHYVPQELAESPPPDILPPDALPALVYMATQPGMPAEGLRLKRTEEPAKIAAPAPVPPAVETSPPDRVPTVADLLAKGPRYVGGAYLETGRAWSDEDCAALHLFSDAASNLDEVAAFHGRPPTNIVFKARDMRLKIPAAWTQAVLDKPQKQKVKGTEPVEPAPGTMSARILGLWREGKRPAEIAAEIKKPRNYVDGTVGSLRKRGLIPKSEKGVSPPPVLHEPDGFLPASAPLWVSTKEIANYLRGQDCDVRKFGPDDWKVNGSALTDAGLLAKANRLREGQGKPSFTLTPP